MLVITIIVIIILAAAVILTINNNNPMDNANKARYSSDRANVQNALSVAVGTIASNYMGDVKIPEQYDISGGISFTTNSGNTKGKIGWDESVKNLPAEYDTTVILGLKIPMYQGNTAIWGIDQTGTIVLTIGDKTYGGDETKQEYAKAGLMLLYDGINNSGNGHDSNATIWKDLSGNGHDGILTNFTTSGDSGWKDSYLKFDGIAGWVDTGMPGATTFETDSEFTLNAIFDFNQITAQGNGYPPNGDTGVVLGVANYGGYAINWMTKFGDSSVVEVAGGVRALNQPLPGWPNSVGGIKNFTIADKKISMTLTYSKKNNELRYYHNGTLIKKDVALKEKYDRGEIFGNIGLNKRQIMSGNYRVMCADMNIYGAKIYDRALTEDEIIQNYLVDKEKYKI